MVDLEYVNGMLSFTNKKEIPLSPYLEVPGGANASHGQGALVGLGLLIGLLDEIEQKLEEEEQRNKQLQALVASGPLQVSDDLKKQLEQLMDKIKKLEQAVHSLISLAQSLNGASSPEKLQEFVKEASSILSNVQELSREAKDLLNAFDGAVTNQTNTDEVLQMMLKLIEEAAEKFKEAMEKLAKELIETIMGNIQKVIKFDLSLLQQQEAARALSPPHSTNGQSQSAPSAQNSHASLSLQTVFPLEISRRHYLGLIW